jgi:hypothetical protein
MRTSTATAIPDVKEHDRGEAVGAVHDVHAPCMHKNIYVDRVGSDISRSTRFANLDALVSPLARTSRRAEPKGCCTF